MIYFLFKTLKNNKKLKKGGAGPAWMRRGTQGHVAAPRGPAQRAYVARYIYYIYYIHIYKWFFVLPYKGRVIPV